MNLKLREAKQELRRWFASQSNDYLTRVVDECRAGLFGFSDPCHCVRGLSDQGYSYGNTPQHLSAELALASLCDWGACYHDKFGCIQAHDQIADPVKYYEEAKKSDHLARVRTLPIVLAEIRRRAKVQTPQATEAEVSVQA